MTRAVVFRSGCVFCISLLCGALLVYIACSGDADDKRANGAGDGGPSSTSTADASMDGAGGGCVYRNGEEALSL